MRIRVENKTALITGGSSGIGFAIAKELAAKGYGLVLVSNQQSDLEKCVAEIKSKFKIECISFCMDLSQSSAAQNVFDFCTNKKIEIDILVNNAGILIFSEFAKVPAEKISTILNLHINTPTLLCNLFGVEMKNRHSGSILNVSSISSVMPYPGISIYGPSKTYMRYFTRALRSEMLLHNVNVCCLIPGATATALYDPQRINVPLAMKLGIMHTPDFVATRAVKALLNNKAECVTGWLNKITMRLMPIIPNWLIVLIHRKTEWVQKGNNALG